MNARPANIFLFRKQGVVISCVWHGPFTVQGRHRSGCHGSTGVEWSGFVTRWQKVDWLESVMFCLFCFLFFFVLPFTFMYSRLLNSLIWVLKLSFGQPVLIFWGLFTYVFIRVWSLIQKGGKTMIAGTQKMSSGMNEKEKSLKKKNGKTISKMVIAFITFISNQNLYWIIIELSAIFFTTLTY